VVCQAAGHHQHSPQGAAATVSTCEAGQGAQACLCSSSHPRLVLRAARPVPHSCIAAACCLSVCASREPWERYELRLPADGGRLASERAQQLGMHWVYARLQEQWTRWAAAGSSSSSSQAQQAVRS
jgi:hypothetical protein